LERWLWNEQIDKINPQMTIAFPGCYTTPVLPWNQFFSTYVFGGNCPQSLHLTQPRPFPPTPVKSRLNIGKR